MGQGNIENKIRAITLHKTPREMKDQIMKLLDEWKGQQKEIAKPERKPSRRNKDLHWATRGRGARR